jgi:hypothetical protein
MSIESNRVPFVVLFVAPHSLLLAGCRILSHLEGSVTNNFSHSPATNALGADVNSFMRSVGCGDSHSLEIGLEFPACDPRDLCTDTTQVLLLTTGRYRIAHLGTFTADVALPAHRLILVCLLCHAIW